MHGIEKRYVFLFSAPQVSAWVPCFRSVDLFPPGGNGGFHLWRYSGGPLGRLLRPVVSPRFKCPGCRFTWSPGLFLLELASVTFRLWQLPLPLLFFTPFACLVSDPRRGCYMVLPMFIPPPFFFLFFCHFCPGHISGTVTCRDSKLSVLLGPAI